MMRNNEIKTNKYSDKVITFRDLFDYIRITPTEDDYIVFGNYSLQVYGNKRQVNICIKDTYNIWSPMGVFIFDGDEVNIYECNSKGCTLYDAGETFRIDQVIVNTTLTNGSISWKNSIFKIIQNLLIGIL